MFRRLEAILISAIVTVVVTWIAARRYPSAPFQIWLLLETVLFVVRVSLTLYIFAWSRQRNGTLTLHPWMVDLFLIAGTVWSAATGYGCLISFAAQDPGLCVMAGVMATGTVGGQSARNPSSPRLNVLQMSLVSVPMIGAALCSDIPLVPWTGAMIPLFLAGMSVITLHIHDDYCAMIVGRIEARKRALHCSLTGLPNRAFFDLHLGTVLQRSELAAAPLALLYLDLDGFKVVNDSFGHPIGDLLLQQVATRLRCIARDADVAARLGGDEFALLLEATGQARAEAMATSIIAALSQPYELTPLHSSTVGVSIGIALVGPDDAAGTLTPALLIEEADAALYQAKRSGRGSFRTFDRSSAPKGVANRVGKPARISAVDALASVAAL